MTAELSKQEESKSVARPLRVLVPLIKQDLTDANEASQRAGMPYRRAAGEKMIEARRQMNATEFDQWCQLNFKVGRRQANEYMNLARHNSGIGDSQEFTSMRDVIHQTRNNPNYGKPASWQAPVRESIDRAKREAERIRDESLNRQQEREAEQKLALRLIDIGWKVLAKELHPDKGGSRDVMARLNRVRDRLKQHA